MINKQAMLYILGVIFAAVLLWYNLFAWSVVILIPNTGVDGFIMALAAFILLVADVGWLLHDYYYYALS